MSYLQREDRLLFIEEIKANPRSARTDSKAQIGEIVDRIKALGFGDTLILSAGRRRFKSADPVNSCQRKGSFR